MIWKLSGKFEVGLGLFAVLLGNLLIVSEAQLNLDYQRSPYPGGGKSSLNKLLKEINEFSEGEGNSRGLASLQDEFFVGEGSEDNTISRKVLGTSSHEDDEEGFSENFSGKLSSIYNDYQRAAENMESNLESEHIHVLSDDKGIILEEENAPSSAERLSPFSPVTSKLSTPPEPFPVNPPVSPESESPFPPPPRKRNHGRRGRGRRPTSFFSRFKKNKRQKPRDSRRHRPLPPPPPPESYSGSVTGIVMVEKPFSSSGKRPRPPTPAPPRATASPPKRGPPPHPSKKPPSSSSLSSFDLIEASESSPSFKQSPSSQTMTYVSYDFANSPKYSHPLPTSHRGPKRIGPGTYYSSSSSSSPYSSPPYSSSSSSSPYSSPPYSSSSSSPYSSSPYPSPSFSSSPPYSSSPYTTYSSSPPYSIPRGPPLPGPPPPGPPPVSLSPVMGPSPYSYVDVPPITPPIAPIMPYPSPFYTPMPTYFTVPLTAYYDTSKSKKKKKTSPVAGAINFMKDILGRSDDDYQDQQISRLANNIARLRDSIDDYREDNRYYNRMRRLPPHLLPHSIPSGDSLGNIATKSEVKPGAITQHLPDWPRIFTAMGTSADAFAGGVHAVRKEISKMQGQIIAKGIMMGGNTVQEVTNGMAHMVNKIAAI